jgi:L-asparaginase
LYFGGALLRGNRAVKESADSIMAFTSPNYPKLAKAGIDIEYRDKILLTPAEGSILHVAEMKESKLGVIKVFPGMQFEIFAPVIKDALDGLILETFGTGNIPSYDHALTDLISDACSRGAIVVVCTQCAEGTVRLGAYEAGSALVKAGALSGHNMTTEATVTKLSYLLSKDLPREEIKRLMGCSLRGEF